MNVHKLSASNIEVYMDCPFRYKLKYHDRVPEPELLQETNFRAIGTAVHSSIQRLLESGNQNTGSAGIFLNKVLAEELSKNGLGLPVYNEWSVVLQEWLKRTTLPNKENILGTEMEISIEFPNGVPVTMYVDLVEKVNDNLIRIRDWKTGQPYSDEDIEENLQAPMYILGISQKYGVKQIEFIFDFVRHVQLKYLYDDNKMRQSVKFIRGVYDAILSDDPEKVEARINRHCGYCGYFDRCPHIISARNGKFVTNYHTSGDLNTLIKSQLNVDNAIKMLTEDKERMRSLILNKMESDGITEQITDEFTAKMTQSKFVNYDVRTILKAFPDKLDEVISVRKTGVDKYIDSLPAEVRADIEDSAANNFSNPSLRITQKRGKNATGKR